MTVAGPVRGARSRCVTRDGVRIAYTSFGRRGRAYIVIHGWCCDQSLVMPVAAHLARKGRAVTLDLRGHGRSGRPDGALDLAGFLEDVRAVAAASGIRSAVLVGHSMGGRVALAAASAMPRFVQGLVLLDTAVFEDPGYVANRWRQLSGTGFRSALRARVAALCAPPTLPSTAARASRVMNATSRSIALESLRVADGIDAPKALSEFAGPVFYVAASSPRESMEGLRRMRPGVLYAQAVGAGHFVHLDAAAQVDAALDRFRSLELAPSRYRPATRRRRAVTAR